MTAKFNSVCETLMSLIRTRQIIRYRATATLRRPQIKQYTASNEGGGVLQNQREHHDKVKKDYFTKMIFVKGSWSFGKVLLPIKVVLRLIKMELL